MEQILAGLGRFNIDTIGHSQQSLLDHLKGTYSILKSWAAPDYLCLAGLCHSLYGTESFLPQPATLDNRTYLRGLIGERAEVLVYLFGAHSKNSLWENLERKNNFSIFDRFTNTSCSIDRRQLSDLITLTLANWLEQRPRARPERRMVRREEFLGSRAFLNDKAYSAFLEAYGIAS